MVFKKIIFQNRYVALETPSRPPTPFMAKTNLNFHFDYLNPSLSDNPKSDSGRLYGNYCVAVVYFPDESTSFNKYFPETRMLYLAENDQITSKGAKMVF